MTELSGIVYQAIFAHCEDLEFRKVYQGNGHHLAQRLAEMVKEEFARRKLKVVEPSLPNVEADGLEPDFDIVKVVKSAATPPFFTVIIKKNDDEEVYEIKCRADEYVDIRLFRKRFVALTGNKFIAFIKQWRWETMLSRASFEVRSSPQEVALSGHIKAILDEFLEQKKENPDSDILKTFAGYNDTDCFFSLNALSNRLRDRGIKATTQEMTQVLREDGWKDDRYVIGSKNPRLWIKPLKK